MKTTHLTGVLTAVAFGGVLIASGVAVAQQAAPQPMQDRGSRALRADVDADGRISRAEFVDARIERLSAADADRDGTVAPEEMRAARQVGMAARADQRFQRLDANGDGMISRAEFDAPRAERGEAKGEGRRGHRGQARRARMDARGPVTIAEARTKAEEAFARMDANNDGFVGPEERRGMREHRRERMSERRSARQASPSTPASE